MSILVMTTMTGTFSARAMPRCSLDNVKDWMGWEDDDSLAHTDQTIVRRHHQQTVVWLAAQQAEDSGSEIPLMPCQIGEADDFRL